MTHDATQNVPQGAPSSPDGATGEPAIPRTPWSRAPLNALRGGLVGAAESVPGISGGTIALVVGLYDELIGSASHVVHALRSLVTDGLRGRGLTSTRAALRCVDWRLLVPVLVGMVVVLLVGLKTLAPLLESQPVPTRAVFFGMIAASVAVPLGMLPGRLRPWDVLLLLAGVAVAFVLTGLTPVDVDDPSLWYVALGAAGAINALVLPGLSGSALLVVLGLYVPVQTAIDERDLAFVGAFALGATLGLAAFVKILQWLLAERRQATMAVLAGLMIGSLRALWPWQDDENGLQAPDGELGTVVLLALAGAAVVTSLVVWERRRMRREVDAASAATP